MFVEQEHRRGANSVRSAMFRADGGTKGAFIGTFDSYGVRTPYDHRYKHFIPPDCL